MLKHQSRKTFLLLPFIVCFFSNHQTFAQQAIDTNEIKANIQVCTDSIITNLPFTKQLASQMLQVSTQANYPWGIFMSKLIIGAVDFNEGNYKEALQLHEEALLHCKANHFKHKESVTIANIGKDYLGLGDYKKAISLYQQALLVAQDIKDTVQIAQAYQGIGTVFNRMKYWKETIKYCSIAAPLFILKNKHSLAKFSYSNIGAAYIDAGNYDSASRYMWLSLYEHQQAMPGAAPPADFYMNMAICYDSLNKKDSAAYCYLKVADICKETGNEILLQAALFHLAVAYASKGQTEKAKEYYKQSLELTEKYNNLEPSINIANSLAELYALTGDYKNAYRYHVKMSVAIDSFLNKEKIQTIAELNTKFETQQLQLKNIELQKKVDAQKYVLLRNWFLFYGGLSLAAISLLGAIFYIRKKKYQYRIQNIELEQKQYHAQMNPHFIFNCMNSIQHYIVHNEVAAANLYLTKFAALMRKTLDNSTVSTIPLREEISYLNNYLLLEKMRFDDKFNYEIYCAENIDINHTHIITMMIQPFVENSIQHGLRYITDRPGKLYINFTRTPEGIICTVDDNGIGRAASLKLKTAANETHRSHGMELVYKRIAVINKLYKMNAAITITDKTATTGQPTGTLVTIKFFAKK